MKVGVALMCHPKRAGFVPSILDALDAPAEVVWDEKQDRWDTGRRSQLAYKNDPEATHWLCIQDDAIICRDLVAGVTEAVEAVPDNPLCLYVGNVTPSMQLVKARVQATVAAGSPWMVMEGPWWGPGVVIPTKYIDEMVAWGDQHPEIVNYDRRMARWFGSKGIDCYYSMPSLVDHRQDHESLVPGRTTKGRHAFWFIGADRSALEVDWHGSPQIVPPAHATKTSRGWQCSECLSLSSSQLVIQRHIAKRHMPARVLTPGG